MNSTPSVLKVSDRYLFTVFHSIIALFHSQRNHRQLKFRLTAEVFSELQDFLSFICSARYTDEKVQDDQSKVKVTSINHQGIPGSNSTFLIAWDHIPFWL